MTILQSLSAYYDRMAARGDVVTPGWSTEPIGFVITLARDGTVLDTSAWRDASGKKPRQERVPKWFGRSGIGSTPYFLWDNTAYVLGVSDKDPSKTARDHARFKEYHGKVLSEVQDEGMLALLRFLQKWDVAQFTPPLFAESFLKLNVGFRLEGDTGLLHERAIVSAFVERLRVADDGSNKKSTTGEAMCLVSGEQLPIARLHRKIKGVDGTASAEVPLVSFEGDAFKSYGQEQGDNAPTSEAAVFRYSAALNALLERGRSRNRIKVGDATVAFWADASGVGEEAAKAAEDAFAFLVEPPDDAGEAAKVGDALKALAQGRPVQVLDPKLEPGTRFHVLGLAPNAARLSIRFWETDSFEVFAKRLAAHHRDLELQPPPRGWTKPPSIQRLLVRTTALLEKFDNIPPLLAGEVARAVLTGASYPRTLLSAAVIRLRAGDDPGFGWHAAVIKACLNRPIERELDRLRLENAEPERRTRLDKERMPVALERDRDDVPYNLGRLFYVLESAQRAALGSVNATIADRYYGSASATPARVFGPLLRGLRNHVSDARKRGQGGWIEPKVAEIMAKLPPELPRTLKLEEQGRFAIGYYHERGTRPEDDAGEAAKTDGNGGEE